MIALDNHPCFNVSARHASARIHLAVAPHCNVQCNFCDRQFDCTNESRPGVTTSLLRPEEALHHLEVADNHIPNLSVVGIAGPGDPFANPNETMETLTLVRKHFPDKLLCVSTNGLNIQDYVPQLAELKVSHVTVTVNAVDPSIGAKIYEWVHFNHKTYFGEDGARLLFQRQTEALRTLKRHGITVKINTVVVPRVNEHHVADIARYTAELGADLQNCIPLIPVNGTPFGLLYEPSAENMRSVRAKTSLFLPQMAHCARCRADAAGLLSVPAHDKVPTNTTTLLRSGETAYIPDGKYVAIATRDGKYVDVHLGQAQYLWIYKLEDGKVTLVEQRSVIHCRENDDRWNALADTLADCSALLVAALGQAPHKVLHRRGLYIEAVEGPVDELVASLFTRRSLPPDSLRFTGFCADRCP
ncbi:MAG: radical SAM protein [Tannerellaceae bacterium]|jgi:nitrogen fixation protein NifB|nr:radical SAM protein [Tannerellaceae bacterium]